MSLECPLDKNYISFGNRWSIHIIDRAVTTELVVNFHVEWDCRWRCFCECVGNITSKGDAAFGCSNNPEESLCWMLDVCRIIFGKGDSSSISFASVAWAS